MDEIEDGAAEKEKRTGESVDTVQRDSIKKTPPGWLQPVLIGIGTATLSAILVVIISYMGQ
jgi:hypothetical protein